MQISIQEAENIASEALLKAGYSASEIVKIVPHLLDSELRGFGIAGLARILSIIDRLAGERPASKIEIINDAPAVSRINGHDTLGYLVAHKATEIAIEKAQKCGIAAVGASNTYYTGMLSYYAEMAASKDLITIIASNCSPWVAPYGTYKPLVGTNPFCIAFPTSSGVPIIWDIGTSKIIHAEVVLARRLGTELPPDSALNAAGEPTTDPQEALNGALAVWGGAKGSGLAIAVQLLGVLAGSPALPPDLKDFGFLIITVNPAMFRPIEEFKKEVDDFVKACRQAPPTPGKEDQPLRLPFERSNRVREEARKAGAFKIEAGVVERLREYLETR